MSVAQVSRTADEVNTAFNLKSVRSQRRFSQCQIMARLKVSEEAALGNLNHFQETGSSWIQSAIRQIKREHTITKSVHKVLPLQKNNFITDREFSEYKIKGTFQQKSYLNLAV